jgi:hypothetical protein
MDENAIVYFRKILAKSYKVDIKEVTYGTSGNMLFYFLGFQRDANNRTLFVNGVPQPRVIFTINYTGA